MSLPQVNKNLLDVSQIFQTYMTFGGDAAKTAAALNLDKIVVEQLATSENWKQKVAEWNSILDGDSQDVQVQINRAVNYVQSHRLRAILDTVIQELAKKDGAELVDMLTVVTSSEDGPSRAELKTRPLTDLVKAAEAVQAMSQRALGDTAAERPDEPGNGKGSSIALLVMQAMNAAQDVGLDSAGVVRKQIAAPPKPLRESE
jgi:hypothetical protein